MEHWELTRDPLLRLSVPLLMDSASFEFLGSSVLFLRLVDVTNPLSFKVCCRVPRIAKIDLFGLENSIRSSLLQFVLRGSFRNNGFVRKNVLVNDFISLKIRFSSNEK